VICTTVIIISLAYQHACAQRSHAGIAFSQWSKNGFFAPQGRYIAPINMKFGTGRSAFPCQCQISRLSGRNVGIQHPKLSKFGILAINLPLKGDSFAQFVRNSQRFYASINGSFFYRATRLHTIWF